MSNTKPRVIWTDGYNRIVRVGKLEFHSEFNATDWLGEPAWIVSGWLQQDDKGSPKIGRDMLLEILEKLSRRRRRRKSKAKRKEQPK